MSPRTFSVASATALALASVSIAAPSHALDGIELPIDTEVTSPLAGAVTIDARSVLAAGRITDSNGLPARGVPVTAYAYPSKIPAEVGFKFELTPVGTTVTDSSGNYQIRTDTAALRPLRPRSAKPSTSNKGQHR